MKYSFVVYYRRDANFIGSRYVGFLPDFEMEVRGNDLMDMLINARSLANVEISNRDLKPEDCLTMEQCHSVMRKYKKSRYPNTEVVNINR